jgi:hypothetical protein
MHCAPSKTKRCFGQKIEQFNAKCCKMQHSSLRGEREGGGGVPAVKEEPECSVCVSWLFTNEK